MTDFREILDIPESFDSLPVFHGKESFYDYRPVLEEVTEEFGPKDFEGKQFALMCGDRRILFTIPGMTKKKMKFWSVNRFFMNFVPFKNKHVARKEFCYIKMHFKGSYKNYSIWNICADLDKMPEDKFRHYMEELGISLMTNQFDKRDPNKVFRAACKVLAQYLQKMIGPYGYVFISPRSGRPKIIFTLKFSQPIKTITRAVAEPILRKIMSNIGQSHDFSGYLDYSDNGMFTTFVPENQFNFCLRVEALRPINVSVEKYGISVQRLDSLDENDTSTIAAPASVYSIADALPEELQATKLSVGRKRFLRVLLNMGGLTRNRGFGISQKMLAHTLGCTQRTAGRYVHWAIRAGLLTCIDHNYQPDKRAKLYVAKGLLSKAIEEHKEGRGEFVIPKRIPDGMWNQYLGEILTRTHVKYKPETFLEVVRTIPGHDEKDRMNQATGWLKWYVGKNPKYAKQTGISP